jgi:hypothetical protein
LLQQQRGFGEKWLRVGLDQSDHAPPYGENFPFPYQTRKHYLGCGANPLGGMEPSAVRAWETTRTARGFGHEVAAASPPVRGFH